jgi:hypothetical protein
LDSRDFGQTLNRNFAFAFEKKPEGDKKRRRLATFEKNEGRFHCMIAHRLLGSPGLNSVRAASRARPRFHRGLTNKNSSEGERDWAEQRRGGGWEERDKGKGGEDKGGKSKGGKGGKGKGGKRKGRKGRKGRKWCKGRKWWKGQGWKGQR